MQTTNRILQILGIPYSALISIIFGMMILSFPLGTYVFFNSEIGNDITHEFPFEYVDTLFEQVSSYLPLDLSLGDVFIVIWSLFLILFCIGIFGPKENFVKSLVPLISFGRDSSSNYLVSALKWFGILVLLSAIIDFIQTGFGITIEPPKFNNDLIQFFSVSLSPLIEEIGFRVILIGLPLYAFFYRGLSLKNFILSLWHPFKNLDVPNQRRVFALIIFAGLLFGMAHVFLGESWSIGKFAQATLGGIILGWVYYRYGLLSAIILHWATNYFIFSYAYFVAHLNDVDVFEAFSHSLLGTFELLFITSGIISLTFLIASNCLQKEKTNLIS